MARPLRIEFKNACYHVISRGNARQSIYKDKQDFIKFLTLLDDVKGRYSVKIYAYVLMDNHYHLLLETQDANLSRVMQQINSGYTNYFKKKHRLCGHLFQGRYKAIVVDKDEYLLELIRYIQLNPVRAKMAQNAEGYRWNSMYEYTGKTKKPIAAIEEVMKYFGNRKKEAQKALINFINDRKENEEKQINIKKPYGGYITGSVTFIKGVLERIKDEQIEEDIIGKKEIIKEIKADKIIELVEKEYRVSRRALLEGKKKTNSWQK